MKISISTIKRIIKEEVDSAIRESDPSSPNEKSNDPNAPSQQMQTLVNKLIKIPVFQTLKQALEKVTSIEMKSKIINHLMTELDPEMNKDKVASKIKTFSKSQQKSGGNL
jgi:hypothetical protein